MRRNGNKEKEVQLPNGVWVYRREYECPGCGRLWLYSVNTNMFLEGGLEALKSLQQYMRKQKDAKDIHLV